MYTETEVDTNQSFVSIIQLCPGPAAVRFEFLLC